MNERIVKLFMESVDSNYIPLPIEDHMPLWTEKFAELIVRECVQVVDSMADPEDSERYFWAIQNASQKIKEHFGLGMSVEDKKQLIKDLLGVNNDTKS